MRKYRRLKGHKIRASRFLEQFSEKKPYPFVHWQKGMVGAFAWWERSESRGSRTDL